ncbi:hypothetical protein ROZALSC1DRAFT_27861 [Rozella allomycis CSF55]|uniref:Glycoside hydrolase, family 18, catalytic domain-containing protein n=1 Tax=Rozella allomycis (strain CSF55) TaxID=988480 RepID=A0A075AU03_ROZAC|nr:Glycoside hydrolase, family 18, catalytic domain-containing protein [Rozella allomycis CSF55]RKP20678.1 hypothetical protein ROZALSC1DRAFT_27861 [Rozella allomycis CSF55]|eukprot:EPZ32195.1 Glycoside hydrolase, family 18, catalytic domain-containing protein [Rozella allomycis CSF55]
MLSPIVFPLLYYQICCKNVVGFFTSWSSYSGFSVTDIDPTKYTIVMYAFMNIDPNTNTCVLGDSYMDATKIFPGDNPFCNCCARGSLNQLFGLKKQYPYLKTMISIGGWTWSSNFNPVSSTSARRQAFAASCIKIMTDYGLDGIDIDWEYPSSQNDVQNLIALLQEFRNQMDSIDPQRYLLTMDSAPMPWYGGALDWLEISQVVDWINIMTYEFSLDDKPWTRHNANLQSNSADPNAAIIPYLSCVNSINKFIGYGIPSNKLMLGIPVFGRVYANVTQGISNGLYQMHDDGNNPSMISYKDIIDSSLDQSFQLYYDNISKASYAYNNQSKQFITFDSVDSVIEKSLFANQQNLAGLMFWEISSDTNGANSSLAYTARNNVFGLDLTNDSSVYEPRSAFCNINGGLPARIVTSTILPTTSTSLNKLSYTSTTLILRFSIQTSNTLTSGVLSPNSKSTAIPIYSNSGQGDQMLLNNIEITTISVGCSIVFAAILGTIAFYRRRKLKARKIEIQYHKKITLGPTNVVSTKGLLSPNK